MLFSIVVILEQSVKFLGNKSCLEKFELFITNPLWVPELDHNGIHRCYVYIFKKENILM